MKEVDTSNRVYLTRNGHGEYGILTMVEIDELDCYRADYTLFYKLQKAEERASKEGWTENNGPRRREELHMWQVPLFLIFSYRFL